MHIFGHFLHIPVFSMHFEMRLPRQSDMKELYLGVSYNFNFEKPQIPGKIKIGSEAKQIPFLS